MIKFNASPKTNPLIKIGSICLSFVLVLIACQNEETKTEKKITDSTSMVIDSVKQINIALVDNKKDPTCGMPVTAGIGDTAHYNNKVIGFCSTECKREFLKNPEANLVAAELKK